MLFGCRHRELIKTLNSIPIPMQTHHSPNDFSALVGLYIHFISIHIVFIVYYTKNGFMPWAHIVCMDFKWKCACAMRSMYE